MPQTTWIIPAAILLYAAVVAAKRGSTRGHKVWIVAVAIALFLFVFGVHWSGSGVVTFGVCVAAGYFILRWRRESTPEPLPSRYLAEVQYAVDVLCDEKRRFELFDVVGLFVRRKDKHGRFMRYMPTLRGIESTVFGASARFLAVDGQELADWRKASGRLATALMVPSVVVSEPKPGVFQLDLRVRDPLGTPVTLDSVKPLTDWVLQLGTDEHGNSKSIPISNVSGVVVGGLPGSGKTAWLTQTLASFSGCDSAQMVVVDGKGGMDLSALRPRSYRFVDDDMDLDAVIGALHEVKELVRERSQNLHDLLGTSNFWNHGPTPEVPVVLVLIDECQTFLDPRQLVGKENKAKGTEIHALVSFLVRKGRSAGVVTILTTQKPTADSLPTDIRDNSSVRVCFGVQSRYAAEAVLGDDWSADSPASPLGAPVGVGVASVDSAFVRFRAPYVREAAVADWVNHFAGLTRDPSQLLHNQLAQLS
ncbi:cell division protein FtsK [Mycolicibacterium sp. PAM1]|uniref:cell division protein FtsK n=1 Tax=Mycolicibacterium sp. PAM1 TaxID=2853535 RepID=UPI001C3CF607|nr:cell division protein FtsK [Mycolicibacterium sp. PAM1]MBV5246931.1 cell division protein FtsK [Mycolicibacterium sp. PAM1]